MKNGTQKPKKNAAVAARRTGSKTLPLRDLPTAIDAMIRKEQLRLELHENIKLKKEHVVYRMLNEWYRLKSQKPAAAEPVTVMDYATNKEIKVNE